MHFIVCKLKKKCQSNWVAYKQWGNDSLFQIGSLSMEIIESELKRHDAWLDDLKNKKKLTEDKNNKEAKKDYERANVKYKNLLQKQDQLLRGEARNK